MDTRWLIGSVRAFRQWPKPDTDEVESWIDHHRKLCAFQHFSSGAAGPNSLIKSKDGIAVDTLLVWCGLSAATLVAAGHISKQSLGQKRITTFLYFEQKSTSNYQTLINGRVVLQPN
ncbi:hypothetical protein ACRWQL_01655 [Shewanella sp. HL-SH4]|uniref:hypothetical protein n=1 Tax=Shewanella sp. HL-SH4 TaxID=3436240 RepID=UPI003EB785C1